MAAVFGHLDYLPHPAEVPRPVAADVDDVGDDDDDDDDVGVVSYEPSSSVDADGVALPLPCGGDASFVVGSIAVQVSSLAATVVLVFVVLVVLVAFVASAVEGEEAGGEDSPQTFYLLPPPKGMNT